METQVKISNKSLERLCETLKANQSDPNYNKELKVLFPVSNIEVTAVYNEFNQEYDVYFKTKTY